MKSKKNIFLILIYLYVNYMFLLKDIPTTAQYIVVYGSMAIYLLLRFKTLSSLFINLGKNLKYIIVAIGLYIIILVMSLLTPIIHSTYDFSYLMVLVSILVSCVKILFLLVITKKTTKSKELINEFFGYFITATCFYVLATILMAIFPWIKDFWSSIIFDPNEKISNELYYKTRYGLIGFSGFKQTWLCTVTCIMNLYLILENIQSKRYNNASLYLSLIMLLIGNGFYGRSGMLCSLVCVFFVIAYIGLIKGKIKQLMILLICLISLYFLAEYLKDYNVTFKNWYVWAMTPINNLLTEHSLEMGSVSEMFDKMYFVPSLKTILFGDGYYSDPSGIGYYRHTDIGLMRPMLFYGIFGEIMGYLVPITLLVGIRKVSKNLKINSSGFVMCFLFLFQLIFFEIKGETFFHLISILLGVFLACANQQIHDKKEDTLCRKR